MAEMHTIGCPSCDTQNQPRTAMDGVQEYRCAACGLVYYGPCGCDTTDRLEGGSWPSRDETPTLNGACTVAVAGDWETMTPPLDIRERAATTAHPGC